MSTVDHDSAMENFSANLQNALEEKGLSQSDLARLSGESFMNISRYVRGLRIPSAEVAVEIGRALGLTVEQLFLPPKKSRQIA